MRAAGDHGVTKAWVQDRVEAGPEEEWVTESQVLSSQHTLSA